jgi:Flp pilus assembly protein TadG
MIKKRNISFRRARQRGNALIEFSLMAVVLFMFACGVADFGRLPALAILASGAAEAGIQYGALSPAHYGDLPGMHDAAIQATGNYPGATAVASQFCACSVGGSHVDCPATCATGSPETYVQVVVTIPYTSILRYPWVPDPVSIAQLACTRVQ